MALAEEGSLAAEFPSCCEGGVRDDWENRRGEFGGDDGERGVSEVRVIGEALISGSWGAVAWPTDRSPYSETRLLRTRLSTYTRL